ncbi:MAG: M50 family metallopeptidase, partial [Psychrosphaera sp.]|nr:M50 family metallopeptidase [Psychrosphaera sp.]
MYEIVPPPLRDDLKIGKLVQQGELSYVIKEPDKQEYYHFTEAQYQIMTMFNGTRDLNRLMEMFNQFSGEFEYDIEGLSELYESCREFQLLTRSKQEQNAALLEKIREERKKKLLQGQGSVLFLRFQLVDPNKFFDRIMPKIRFLWHPKVVKAQAVFLVLAFIVVLFQGERFFDDFNRVYLSAQMGGLGILSIWIIALCAIAVHECGHGLTCKYFGGDVHEMGFLLLAFQPCLYCNVNDAWLFESKWQKIYVALAGVWVELLLAGISAFVWVIVDVGNPIGFVAFVLLTIGTFTSLMVNLNPLLKFDGYYILTDMLEMQNLRQNAIAWFSYTLKTKVLRLEEEAPLTPSRRERRIYLIYGALVTVYMIAILSFIAILGYGLVSAHFGFMANLVFIYLVFFLVRKITGSWGETLIHWTKTVFWSTTRRKQVTVGGLVGMLLLLIFWQPRIRIHSNGIVEAPTHIVYAPENGFVSYIGYDNSRHLTGEPNQPFAILSS